jgi:proteasome lid subunit RPN8/RPN11
VPSLITTYLKNQIRTKLDSESKKERCGLLFEIEDGTHAFVEVLNVHPDPANHFAISSLHTERIMKRFPRLVGIVHTHVQKEDAEPSPEDLAQLERLEIVFPGIRGIVYVVPLGLVIEYNSAGVIRKLLIPVKARP